MAQASNRRDHIEKLEAFGKSHDDDLASDTDNEEELRLGCIEWTIFILSGFVYMMTVVIAPFLPIQLADRGIEEVWMGHAITIFALC